MESKQYVILKERVLKDGGEWVYLFKKPAVSEDELAKMRKSKPKTLANINDLNPVVMRSWVSLEGLRGGLGGSSQRSSLVQVEKGADSPEPNLENTYIKLSVSLGSPLARASDGVGREDIIARPAAELVLG